MHYYRVSLPGLLLLLAGCGFHSRLPLYQEFHGVGLGQPMTVGIEKSNPAVKELRTDWPNATGAEERLVVLADERGRVVAKKYELEGERAILPLLWYQSRDRREWVVARAALGGDELSKDEQLADRLGDVCRRLERRGNCEAFDQIVRCGLETGHCSRGSFRRSGTRGRRLAGPLLQKTVWSLSRTPDDVFHLLIEERGEVSMVAWTLFGWVGILTGHPPWGKPAR